jgi:hypothetical protein
MQIVERLRQGLAGAGVGGPLQQRAQLAGSCVAVGLGASPEPHAESAAAETVNALVRPVGLSARVAFARNSGSRV